MEGVYWRTLKKMRYLLTTFEADSRQADSDTLTLMERVA